MHILYIVQHFTGPAGSSGSRPYENARRLVRLGHRVTLLCGSSDLSSPEDIEAARQARIDIVQAPIAYSQQLSYLQRLLVFFQYLLWAIGAGKRVAKPDLVFASSTPLTTGEIGRRVARYHRVPFVFEVRDLWPEVPESLGALRNPLFRWLANRMAGAIYKAAAHVVALSPDMKGRIVEHWGVPEARVSVIPNCSDVHLFGQSEERDRVRAEYGWTEQFVCIHPGSMGLVNGLDYLLDAGKALDALGVTDIRIAILGNGKMKPHLAERIAQEGITAAALYDSIRKSEMPHVLAAADAGIVTVLPRPFLEYNSANKFFDFLAAGLPVIINYQGWKAAVLGETGAGVTVDPHDPATLAQALIALRDDPERCRAMRKAARRTAEDRYNRDMLVRQLDAVLRTVGEKPKHPAAR